MKFRKRIKIAPGVKLNISKSGVSASVGRAGATVNVGGKRGAKATVGIPGSGFSHEVKLSTPKRRASDIQDEDDSDDRGVTLFGVVVVIVGFCLAIVILRLLARL